MTFKDWQSLQIGNYNLVRLVRVSDGTVLYEKNVGPELEDGFHIWIHADAGVSYAPYNIRPAGGSYTIDWGDGTSETKYTTLATGSRPTAHTYAQSGDYKLSLSCGGVNGYAKRTLTYSWFNYLTSDTYNVKSITMKNVPGVTSLASNPFYRCAALSSVIIDDTCTGLTSIPADTFAYCSSLKFVQLPPSITSLTSTSFIGCDGIRMDFRGTTGRTYSTTNYDTFGSNCDLSIHQAPWAMLAGVASDNLKVTMMKEVSSIGPYFAYNINGLETKITQLIVKDPNSVRSIGNYAFTGLSSLSCNIVCNNLTSLGYSPFSRTEHINLSVNGDFQPEYNSFFNVKNVYIGDKVKTIKGQLGTNLKQHFINTDNIVIDENNPNISDGRAKGGRNCYMHKATQYQIRGMGCNDPVFVATQTSGILDGSCKGSTNLKKITLIGQYFVQVTNTSFDDDAQISVYVDPTMISRYQSDSYWKHYPGIQFFPIET